MPRFLNPAVLRQLREALGINLREAAALTGLSLWSIQRHERAELPPVLPQKETTERYCDAYKATEKQVTYWSVNRAACPELELAGHGRIKTPSGEFDILDASLHRKCSTAYALFAGRRFVVAGRVLRHASLSDSIDRALNARPGEAAQFQLRRVAKGEAAFGATVLTRTRDHTRQLVEQAESMQPVLVVAELIVRQPGSVVQFPVFTRGRPSFRPFAFVVDEVVQANAHA
jgi:hypothetical protein